MSGNCYYSKNRSSFETYGRVKGTAQSAKVIGIGTVVLRIHQTPGTDVTGKILLRNVLHIPNAPRNGLNNNKAIDMGGAILLEKGITRIFSKPGGQPVCYATGYRGVRRLVLAGNPQGEPVQDIGNWSLSRTLSAEERRNLVSQGEEVGIYVPSLSVTPGPK